MDQSARPTEATSLPKGGGDPRLLQSDACEESRGSLRYFWGCNGWHRVHALCDRLIGGGRNPYFLFAKVREHEKNLTFSYALILSGAIGNLVDRFRFGEVIDFLDYYISSFHWPAFNIADAAICAGIGLMAIELLSKDIRNPLSQPSATPSQHPPASTTPTPPHPLGVILLFYVILFIQSPLEI